MAIIYKWVTQNGGPGTHSGDAIGNSYTMAELVTHIGTISSNFTDHRVFFLCGDFDITGTLFFTLNGSPTAQAYFIGMDTSGSVRQQATIDAGGGAFPIIHANSTSAEWTSFFNLTLQNTNKASGNDGFRLGTNGGNSATQMVFYECLVEDCYVGFNTNPAGGSSPSDNMTWVRCTAKNNAAQGYLVGNPATATTVGRFYECAAISNGHDGFRGCTHINRCLAAFNTLYGFNGYNFAAQCTSHGNGSAGFRQVQAIQSVLHRCIATGNGTYGCEMANADTAMSWFATYNNTSGRHNQATLLDIWDREPIVMSMLPYVDAVGLDFALNDIETGGRMCRNTDGFTFPDGLSVSYHDIGFSQHCCPIQEETAVGGPWALEYIAARLIHGGKNRVG